MLSVASSLGHHILDNTTRSKTMFRFSRTLQTHHINSLYNLYTKYKFLYLSHPACQTLQMANCFCTFRWRHLHFQVWPGYDMVDFAFVDRIHRCNLSEMLHSSNAGFTQKFYIRWSFRTNAGYTIICYAYHNIRLSVTNGSANYRRTGRFTYIEHDYDGE